MVHKVFQLVSWMKWFQGCGNNPKWCFECTSYKLGPLDGTKVRFTRHPLIVMFTNSCSHSDQMLVAFLHCPKFFPVVCMYCILVLQLAHLLQFSLPSQDLHRLKKYNFKNSRIVQLLSEDDGLIVCMDFWPEPIRCPEMRGIFSHCCSYLLRVCAEQFSGLLVAAGIKLNKVILSALLACL